MGLPSQVPSSHVKSGSVPPCEFNNNNKLYFINNDDVDDIDNTDDNDNSSNNNNDGNNINNTIFKHSLRRLCSSA